MQIIEVTKKQFWNEFVARNSSPSSFLQSWEWGEFQRSLGNQVYHLMISDRLAAQVIAKTLPFGRTYLEVPKGPVLNLVASTSAEEVWKSFVAKLREIGKKEKAVLVRVNPPYENLSEILIKFGFRQPEFLLRQREPEQTILVDLSKTEEELLQNMHEKSRYNIRLAIRRGVKVWDATSDKEAFESFLNLLEETTKRDRITTWPEERFWKFRETLMRPRQLLDFPSAILLVGTLDGKILAGAIIMLFGDSGTYLYAASSGEERSANAPSLVLWEAIKQARSQGKRWYDMWGIAPLNEPEHSWAGITRFKSRYVKIGVTGQEINYEGARDLRLDRMFYLVFKIAKRLRD